MSRLKTVSLPKLRERALRYNCAVLERGTRGSPVFSPRLEPHAGSRLRRFTAYSDRQLLILGARRSPAIPSPNANTDTGIPISTSVGFRHLEATEYTRAATELGADIVLGLGDFINGDKLGMRRREKLFGRSERWTKALVDAVNAHETDHAATGADLSRAPAVFAPVLPMPVNEQRWYLEFLSEDLGDHIAGLVVYNPEVGADLPAALASFPRLAMTGAETPQQLLLEIANGMDVLTAPFVGEATDSGIALCFEFPARPRGDELFALGEDMLLPIHATVMQGLVEGCKCYTCTRHSRAYVRHLLTAKEMLAWVLLQLHNLHVVHEFFGGIRASITRGTFNADCEAFETTYATELPDATGIRPRTRGYQKKSGGPSDRKMNSKAFRARADAAAAAAATGPSVRSGNDKSRDASTRVSHRPEPTPGDAVHDRGTDLSMDA